MNDKLKIGIIGTLIFGGTLQFGAIPTAKPVSMVVTENYDQNVKLLDKESYFSICADIVDTQTRILLIQELENAHPELRHWQISCSQKEADDFAIKQDAKK